MNEISLSRVLENLKLSQDTNQSDSIQDTNQISDCVCSNLNTQEKSANFSFCNSKLEDVTMGHESEVYESMKLIGYDGPLLNFNEYKKALAGGPKSLKYSELVSFLVNELKVAASIDESVNPITIPDDSITFIMEVSSLLNELGCPYKCLTQGHVSERLHTISDRLILIDYLISQVMASRIIRQNKPEKQIELKLKETSQAADLSKILEVIGLSKPPANITMHDLMQKLNQRVDGLVKRVPQLVGKPLFNETLSPGEWDDVNKIQTEIHQDYTIRREMLLKRLDCTIQSFQWSGKTKGKEEALNKAFFEKRKLLKTEPDVDVSDLIAAREDLAIIEKTSSASVRGNTKSSVYSVIIGQVPDRGGRTSELAPPPPEMPAWQQRSAGPNTGFKRGGQQQRGGRQQQYEKNNFSQGQRSFDSVGSYGQDSRGSYQQGSQANTAGNWKSQGQSDYSQSNSGSYNQGNSGSYNQGNSGSYNQGYGNNYRQSSFDSAGSYGGGYSSQEPKRAKTYDQFQQHNTTYADQYVQDSQQNQQRGGNRGRGGHGGRSNYNRGGYR